jgi:transposase
LAGGPQRPPWTDRELDALWADLAADAERARAAHRTLAAIPAEAVRLLGARLRPVPPADKAAVGRLIADLGSDEAVTRDRAEERLVELGTDPWPFVPKIYRERNCIERLVGKLKQFRRVATRYEKLAETFMAMIHLASAFIMTR